MTVQINELIIRAEIRQGEDKNRPAEIVRIEETRVKELVRKIILEEKQKDKRER
jgi:hypothetical protein